MTAPRLAQAVDALGLRRALPGRALPLAAACMMFLAALAGAAGVGAARLAASWRVAGDTATVQVPDPESAAAGGTRAAAVAASLPAGARRLSGAEIAGLLRPWLGEDASGLSLVLPAVFTVPGKLPAAAEARLGQVAPGTLVARGSVWQDRFARLADSLQACAACALAAVALVAGCVVAIAARSGLAACREAITIVHALGATDAMIAGRFARRLAAQAGGGALLGVLAAVPMLAGLARLAAPLGPGLPSQAPGLAPAPVPALAGLPASLWGLLATLPLLAALIGWAAAQASVRVGLGRLP